MCLQIYFKRECFLIQRVIYGEGEQISSLWIIGMPFESGKKPYAHIFFGKPNLADVGQKACILW